MKNTARIVAFVLLLVSLLTFAVPASANTITYSGSKAPRFGKSVEFYVKTDNKASTDNKVKAVFEKGTMFISGKFCCSWSCRCSYEAIVYFKNSAGNWQWESQSTCYNTGSKTLTLKKANTEYKVVIRAKDAMVVWDSYVKNDIVSPCSKCKAAANSASVCWKVSAPTVKLQTVSGTGSISK